MRARTDLWEPGASNRLGPPGPQRISRKSRSEIRVDHQTQKAIPHQADVPRTERVRLQLLCPTQMRTEPVHVGRVSKDASSDGHHLFDEPQRQLL